MGAESAARGQSAEPRAWWRRAASELTSTRTYMPARPKLKPSMSYEQPWTSSYKNSNIIKMCVRVCVHVCVCDCL